MSRFSRQAGLRDEPDFLGLNEEQAEQLAAERGLILRLIHEEDEGPWTMELNRARVTAELEGGVIVYAQRA